MPKKILFVEDEPYYQTIYGKVLEKAGHEIVYALRGDEALDLFRSQTFDVVIVDLIMPIMSGQKFLKSLRSSRKKRQAVILVLTTLEGTSDREDAVNSGADAFYMKSQTTPKKFLEIINALP